MDFLGTIDFEILYSYVVLKDMLLLNKEYLEMKYIL